MDGLPLEAQLAELTRDEDELKLRGDVLYFSVVAHVRDELLVQANDPEEVGLHEESGILERGSSWVHVDSRVVNDNIEPHL